MVQLHQFWEYQRVYFWEWGIMQLLHTFGNGGYICKGLSAI